MTTNIQSEFTCFTFVKNSLLFVTLNQVIVCQGVCLSLEQIKKLYFASPHTQAALHRTPLLLHGSAIPKLINIFPTLPCTLLSPFQKLPTLNAFLANQTPFLQTFTFGQYLPDRKNGTVSHTNFTHPGTLVV